MAYTLLTSSKLLISSSLIAKVFIACYFISPPSNSTNGRCTQIDLKRSWTRWSKYSEGHLQTFLATKERRALTSILPLVDTNGFVEKLTLFLPGLALLQSPRTKYSISWLVFVRFVTWIWHEWRTSTIPLKTPPPCDEIQEDQQLCTSQININGSTTLQLHHQLPSSSIEARVNKKKPSITMTLGWIG
jgi:hypothetical protein